MRAISASMIVAVFALSACGESDSSAATEPADAGAASADSDVAPADAPEGLETVPPTEIADVIADAPDGLVVLDVRTPEEFAEARLDGATLLDFYRTDFREQLAELDRDTPYVLYCRSDNRSGEALQMMRDLGFTSVREADGGILAWMAAELPVVSG